MFKYKGLFLVLLAMMLALPVVTEAQLFYGDYSNNNDRPSISVSGEAEIWVAPDEVTIYAGIEIWSTDLDSAVTATNDRAEKTLKLADEFHIEPRHIQTDYINIFPTAKRINSKDIEGFLVQKSITITLRDMNIFNEFMEALVKDKANVVRDISFRSLELKKYREQVRTLAIQAAKEKAEMLSSAIGQSIGKATSIKEGRYYSGYWGFDSWGRRNDNVYSQVSIQDVNYDAPVPEGSVAVGQIRIYAKVDVVFKLQ